MTILLIKNIGLLQTPTGSYSHRGAEQGKNLKLENASILIQDGIIQDIQSADKLAAHPRFVDKVIDAEGKLVTPGLVDGHTHLVFGGYRHNEIPMKLKGASYLDILKAGGGILDTVRKTRQATEEELYDKTAGFLDEMMALGVTTCEAKSGYGLDLETEMKMMRVVKTLSQTHHMDLVSTYMGAHAIPEEYKARSEEFIKLVIEEYMPAVKEEGLADFCDIFCEEGVFNVEESRTYLQAARELGFGLKIHADEIKAIGGSKLAGEIGADSAEHLIAIDEQGLKAMAEGGTTAMLLPATSFYLGADFAPARKMIDMGIPVATATDFNPGSCPSLNLQFVINLAYLRYKMMPEEILTAVTINPAAAIGRADRLGTLEVGKQADLVIWNAPNMEMLCYRFGSNLVSKVIKKGVEV